MIDLVMDYFAVYVKSPVDNHKHSFLCHVVSYSESSALSCAKSQGFNLPRGSYAVRIGTDGYFLALSRVFNVSKGVA